MNPIIIVGGIYITSRVVSALFEELTNDERKKQEDIRKNASKYDGRINELNRINAEHQADTQRLFYEEIQKKISYLRAEVASRKAYERDLKNDISDSLKKLNQLINKKEITTALRKNGLEKLLNQLHEANDRCFGYIKYLEKYERYLNVAEKNKENPVVFEMKLPSDFPYIGKLVYIDYGLLKSNIQYRVQILNGIDINYLCLEDLSKYDYPDEAKVPFLVEGFSSENNFSYIISLTKGLFSTEVLANTRIGVRATVSEITKPGVVLAYNDNLKLFLKNENLMKPYRKPLIRSTMTVYPIRWNYALSDFNNTSYPVQVSEHVEDAVATLRYGVLPLIFSDSQWDIMQDYLIKQNLLSLEDEWKIGPADESSIIIANDTLVKLQFGDVLVISASLHYYDSNGEKTDESEYYFAHFEGILPLEEAFDSDDLFVGLDINMTPVIEQNTVQIKEYIDDNLPLFWIDVFSELRNQKKIKESLVGSLYYQQWSEITQKLITYLKKGVKFTAEISLSDCVLKNKNYYLSICNSDELRKHIENYIAECDSRSNGDLVQLIYLVEDAYGQQFNVTIKADFCELTIYNAEDFEFVENESHLDIYVEVYPYADIQQSIALSHFRIGQLTNPMLQVALMDGEYIESSNEDVQDELKLVNASIRNNKAQYDALVRAYSERNIFFIQGPPGTGKTTIIKELVEQYLLNYRGCRILIVSQANVAVDNALAGIVTNHKDEVVRCGNAAKISEDLQEVSLDYRYKSYINNLKEPIEDRKKEVYERWLDFVQRERGLTSNIGELIIKSHHIVGATCVGLAKRKTGLEKIIFDLVIVDEAGKALPGEILIPVLRAKKLVLIGDHKQLPPVINPALYDPEKIEIENRSVVINNLFEISLFQRLYERTPDTNKTMLTTQYRMPAVLGNLVSELFYSGKLINGNETNRKKPIYHEKNLVFYDFHKDNLYHESESDNAIVNKEEAIFILELLNSIEEKKPGHSIAVITPYRGQNRLLRKTLLFSGPRLRKANIQINTIDAFQGDEAEIVVYCTTRSQKKTKYFSDFKRINVALSRAKNELIIVGSINYFKSYSKKNSPLPEIADYFYKHGMILEGTVNNSQDVNTNSFEIVPLQELYLEKTVNIDSIQRDIDDCKKYYYTNGKMEKPVHTKRIDGRYYVTGDYDVYFAYKFLELFDCWVIIE